jgi:hypothetical protein
MGCKDTVQWQRWERPLSRRPVTPEELELAAGIQGLPPWVYAHPVARDGPGRGSIFRSVLRLAGAMESEWGLDANRGTSGGRCAARSDRSGDRRHALPVRNLRISRAVEGISVASMRRGHIQTRYQRACQCCVEHGVTGKMTMFQRFLIVQCSFLFAFVLDPARRRAWGPKVLAFELMPAMSGGPSAEGRGASRLQVRRQWGAHDATGASLPSADVTEFQNMVSDHRGTEIVEALGHPGE